MLAIFSINSIGLLNKLDSGGIKGSNRGSPRERTRRSGIVAAYVSRELLGEIVKRTEGMRIVKAFLVFPVTAFNLAVMVRIVRTDEFVTNVEMGSGLLKRVKWLR